MKDEKDGNFEIAPLAIIDFEEDEDDQSTDEEG
jgi:hypothetical protein